jgi:hypothetical protein
MNMPAKRKRPTGFSDPSHYEDEVTIVGFVYGWHIDSGRDRGGNTVLAVFSHPDGRLGAEPISHFTLTALSESGTQ